MFIAGFQKTTLLDFPGKIATTIFTGGCNFRCPYCHNKDLVLSPGALPCISEEEIFTHLNNRKNILDGVCITGGEPTLQPDLIHFISKIKDLGFLVKLDTNGTNPDIVNKLLSHNLVDYIAMDIKHCKQKYNDIAQCSDFDISHIQSTIDTLINSSIDYEFRTTVVKELHSVDDIENIGKWLSGAKAYYLQSYKESEQVINPIFSSPDVSELETYADILKKYILNTNIRGVE